MKQTLLSLLMFLFSPCLTGLEKTDMKKAREEKVPDTEFNSTFSYDAAQKLLVIRFIEAEMEKDQPEVVANLRCSTDYSFDEMFELPEDLWRALGATTPLAIKKGRYPMEFREGVYLIYVQF